MSLTLPGPFQVCEQQRFDVGRHADASNNGGPKLDRRRGNHFGRQSDDVQVVVEMIAPAAMLRVAGSTRVTFPIMTDAAEITPAFVGKENVGAEIDILSRTFESATGGCQSMKINGVVDHDKNIGVFRDRFCCGQRTHERYSHHARTIAGRSYERAHREQQMPARLGNRR